MLDNLIRDVGNRLGLGDQTRPLTQMLVAYMANPATGGITGFLDKFRNAGWGSMVQSWMGNASSPIEPSGMQLESVLGGSSDNLLSKIAGRLGLSAHQVTSAVATLLPMLISRLTANGSVSSALPAEFASFARDGAAMLGLSSSAFGSAAASTASAAAAARTVPPVQTPVAPVPAAGIGRWLPWILAALVVLLGITYCSKSRAPVDAPATATVPAPAEPATQPAPVPAPTPAPAVAPEPTPAATAPAAATVADAPAGAGVVDGLQQDVPLLRVFFDTGKTEVAPEFADKAKALVAYLQANGDVKAIISGFNDPTGDPALNAELSKQRAQAVQSALVAAGVPMERTELEKPAETTDTGATNATSRRVDVMLRK